MGVMAGFTFGLMIDRLPKLKAVLLVLAALVAFLISLMSFFYGVPIVALICVILALNLGLFAGSLCGPDEG